MVISASWGALAQQTDIIVDATFGERVQFLPWAEEGYEVAGPDNSRAPSGVMLAILENPDAAEANTAAGVRITSDLKLCIRQSLMPAKLRKGDRVKLLDRDDWTLQIAYIESGATGRFEIHLLRLKSDMP
jgi:hypothetical protein